MSSIRLCHDAYFSTLVRQTRLDVLAEFPSGGANVNLTSECDVTGGARITCQPEETMSVKYFRGTDLNFSFFPLVPYRTAIRYHRRLWAKTALVCFIACYAPHNNAVGAASLV